MLRRTPQPVPEHEARGENARIYHEIRQTLRVSGVNLNFRTWAAFPHFFPPMWAAMQPTSASQAFESAADGLRSRAVDLALALPPLRIGAPLGESQRYQVERALALYHYINPKLLLFTILVRRGLTGEQPSGAGARAELGPSIPFGPPRPMMAMEMVEEAPADARLRRVFRDIKGTMGLRSINSDYRTLALWPDYLEPAWAALKSAVSADGYLQAAAMLATAASAAADRFPTPTSIDLRRLKSRGENTDALLEITHRFERLLPPLILNIALLARGWWPEDQLRRSPFPWLEAPGGADRSASSWREFQRLQRLVEVRDTFISYLDDGTGEPVVLLHGIPTWSYLWTPILGPLTRAARVLAPDLAGFGFSDRRDRFDRSIARQAELVDAWMDRIGVASATVVGHDIGGGVALRLATLFPSRIRKLCVINTVCYDSWPIELMLQLGHPGANRRLSAAMAVRLLKQALKGGFARRPPSALLDGLLAPYSTEVGKLSLIRNAAALNTNLTTEIVPLLGSIHVPTLILWGEDDMFQPIAYGERLAWDIPGADFVRLGSSRHFVMVDRPRAVAARLAAFITDR